MWFRQGSSKIYYTIQAGQGKSRLVFILLHGLAVDHRHPLIKFLASQLVNYGDVISVDLPGHGQSQGGVKKRKVEEFIKAVKILVKQLNQDSRYKNKKIILLGHSIGALTALAAAAELKKSISGAVIIAANAESERLYQNYLQRGMIKFYPTYSTLRNHKVAGDFWANRNSLQPLKFAANISCPILYIYASQDKTNPLADGRKLFNKTRSVKSLAVIPNEGHFFVSEQSKALVIRAIIKWLKQNYAQEKK